ncbi:conserved hypothetical protein [Oleispira antarctica RB-8]|uniref:DUF2157 domain-containing protein n=1 Tax=Oleispira antarctica RB-8 TaxID=698738 RepID=R4YKE4_OLEAN|nr:conserved hypothetical protein [Oleispira antarctica RB-8]
MDIHSKLEAQGRVDQVLAFQSELSFLEQHELLILDDAQNTRLQSYHAQLLTSLQKSYDVDLNSNEKQLTMGMKIASFIGALGLAASLFFLFYQFWDKFALLSQVAILVATPVLGLMATYFISIKETTGYYAKLMALVTLSGFVLNLVMLGSIFNITPSPNAFFVWAVLAFFLAYSTDNRLLLAAGIFSIAFFISARVGVWGGLYWLNLGERPENFFVAALILFWVPAFSHTRYAGFDSIYRVLAMVLFFIPVLVLSHWGSGSYLDFDRDVIEGVYQAAGFFFSGLLIWLGIKRGWLDVVNTGNVFFVLFLYTKMFDWWWEIMPKYVFFLLVGLFAILLLTIFKRLKNSLGESA